MKKLTSAMLALVILFVGVPVIALTVEQVLESVFDSTNKTLKISMTTNEVTTDMTVGDALTVGGVTTFNSLVDYSYADITSTPYTLNTASKTTVATVSYTDTGAASVVLATDLTVAGRMIIIKDAELNAGTNNITIGTEGAETIDEAATYVMNANGEAVTLVSDGTNWFVMSGFAE